MSDASESDLVSKTKRKQQALALQNLGEELTRFKPTRLQALPLPPKLVTAIAEFNRLPNSHGARRRQLQFIGKLMRELDFDEIISAIARQKMQGLPDWRQQQQPAQSGGSACCARILSGGDAEINALLQARPELERQKLRQFQRDHRRADARKRTGIEAKLENYLRLFTAR
ncbi:MAG: DUF615 domain-containing protein [Proteobacteria bacterium]|nr:DUF615 domain-containing protein [Pseudomonadota bacterium]